MGNVAELVVFLELHRRGYTPLDCYDAWNAIKEMDPNFSTDVVVYLNRNYPDKTKKED